MKEQKQGELFILCWWFGWFVKIGFGSDFTKINRSRRMYTRAKPVSRPSFHVLVNAVTLKTLDQCFVNVSEHFVNVLWTFLNVLSTFLSVFWTFLTVLSTFSERFVRPSTFLWTLWRWKHFDQCFVNVSRTFYKHFLNVL
jgi:hypothetical protein